MAGARWLPSIAVEAHVGIPEMEVQTVKTVLRAMARQIIHGGGDEVPEEPPHCIHGAASRLNVMQRTCVVDRAKTARHTGTPDTRATYAVLAGRPVRASGPDGPPDGGREFLPGEILQFRHPLLRQPCAGPCSRCSPGPGSEMQGCSAWVRNPVSTAAQDQSTA